jgi:uncharacterized protein YjbI with pentapeptide repeats
MDEFSDGKVIFTQPQDVVWSNVEKPDVTQYGKDNIDISGSQLAFAYMTGRRHGKSEWFDLTYQEILDALGALEAEEAVFRVARAVESKLKEKNT